MNTCVKCSGNSQSEFPSRPASCAVYPVATLRPNVNCTMHFKCHYASVTCEKSQLYKVQTWFSQHYLEFMCKTCYSLINQSCASPYISFSDKIIYHNKSLQLLQLFWSPVRLIQGKYCELHTKAGCSSASVSVKMAKKNLNSTMTREVKRWFSSLLLNIPLLFLSSWKKLEKCEQTGEIKLSRKG